MWTQYQVYQEDDGNEGYRKLLYTDKWSATELNLHMASIVVDNKWEA